MKTYTLAYVKWVASGNLLSDTASLNPVLCDNQEGLDGGGRCEAGLRVKEQNVIVDVQLLSCVQFFVTSWTVTHQAPLSSIISQRLLKIMSIELVMSSNHLIHCHPLLFLPSIYPSIRVFSNESALCSKWPEY